MAEWDWRAWLDDVVLEAGAGEDMEWLGVASRVDRPVSVAGGNVRSEYEMFDLLEGMRPSFEYPQDRRKSFSRGDAEEWASNYDGSPINVTGNWGTSLGNVWWALEDLFLTSGLFDRDRMSIGDDGQLNVESSRRPFGDKMRDVGRIGREFFDVSWGNRAGEMYETPLEDVDLADRFMASILSPGLPSMAVIPNVPIGLQKLLSKYVHPDLQDVQGMPHVLRHGYGGDEIKGLPDFRGREGHGHAGFNLTPYSEVPYRYIDRYGGPSTPRSKDYYEGIVVTDQPIVGGLRPGNDPNNPLGPYVSRIQDVPQAQTRLATFYDDAQQHYAMREQVFDDVLDAFVSGNITRQSGRFHNQISQAEYESVINEMLQHAQYNSAIYGKYPKFRAPTRDSYGNYTVQPLSFDDFQALPESVKYNVMKTFFGNHGNAQVVDSLVGAGQFAGRTPSGFWKDNTILPGKTASQKIGSLNKQVKSGKSLNDEAHTHIEFGSDLLTDIYDFYARYSTGAKIKSKFSPYNYVRQDVTNSLNADTRRIVNDYSTLKNEPFEPGHKVERGFSDFARYLGYDSSLAPYPRAAKALGPYDDTFPLASKGGMAPTEVATYRPQENIIPLEGTPQENIQAISDFLRTRGHSASEIAAAMNTPIPDTSMMFANWDLQKMIVGTRGGPASLYGSQFLNPMADESPKLIKEIQDLTSIQNFQPIDLDSWLYAIGGQFRNRQEALLARKFNDLEPAFTKYTQDSANFTAAVGEVFKNYVDDLLVQAFPDPAQLAKTRQFVRNYFQQEGSNSFWGGMGWSLNP